MPDTPLDVAIVGAGFGGLAMARALARRPGLRFVILEKAAEAGGTWRDNRYPGAACDVPSHLYSLSDAGNPDWTRLFPPQPEIQAYLRQLAAPFLAAGQLVCGWQLAQARWDAAAACWRLRAADGREACARFLVLALGGLHVPAWPDIPGREDFAGPSWHTARWPEDAELAGRRVGVIGTGASAVQVVPALAASVSALHVFQRTPCWLMPRPDVALPYWLRRAFTLVPPLRLALRGSIFLWLEAVSSGLLHPRTAFWARWLARRHLRRQVADPALRARLTPDYPIGCKRVLISSDYYPALQAPCVQLETEAIERIEHDGVRLADGRRVAVDVLVYATGFHPMAILDAVEVVGREGRRLRDDWADRPQAHLGISVPGYPNLGFLLGPNTALGHNSVLTMIESQVQHLCALIDAAAASGARSVEATPEAQQSFIGAIDRRFRGTAWNGGCRSWYLDASGRNIALWVGSVLGYRRRVRRVRLDDYRFEK